MSDHDDRAYFTARAQRERAIGSTCEDNALALVHLQMADEYERRAARVASIKLPGTGAPGIASPLRL